MDSGFTQVFMKLFSILGLSPQNKQLLVGSFVGMLVFFVVFRFFKAWLDYKKSLQALYFQLEIEKQRTEQLRQAGCSKQL